MNNVSVILVKPASQGNLGAVARAMKNFGFSRLILVSPECEVGEEAFKRARHAKKILVNAKIKKNLGEALKGHSVSIATTSKTGKDYNMPRSPLTMEEAAKKIFVGKARTAVVFGSEEHGLTTDMMRLCDYPVTIPSGEDYRALNLSHAAVIAFYELSKQKYSSELKEVHKPASAREKKELLEHAEKLAKKNSRTESEGKAWVEAWKKMVGKAHLTKREAYALIGFLKKQK